MTNQEPRGTEDSPATAAEAWEDSPELHVEPVRNLFVTFTKALRAFQLYDENNPVYQRFVSALGKAFADLWTELDELQVTVEEDRLLWMGEEVYRAQSRNDSLSFLFFKDGVRVVTFRPGIEGEELPRLLAVIQAARNVRPEGDDLLTILWEADLEHFRYKYVDLLAEGVEIPGASGDPLGDLGAILDQELGLTPEELADPESAAESAQVATSINREDFNPTLYALEPAEMESLRRELQAELDRDLRRDVLAALFDRLEAPDTEERQSEVIGVLRTLLPNFLSRGALDPAAEVVEEMVRLRDSDGLLDERRKGEIDGLLDEVSSPVSVSELVKAVEDGSIRPDPRSLRSFLSQLQVQAFGPILRASERYADRAAGPLLRVAATGMGERHPRAILSLLGDRDPLVAAGAARLAGDMELTEAGAGVSRLMTHSDVKVRRAAVESARFIGASTVASGLQAALEDEEAEIRQGAARALAQLRYRPAADKLRSIVTGRALRGAELSEKIAFFEAYGAVAGPDAIELMDRLLNGKGFLGRKESPEIRACAALALGKVGTPGAVSALQDASADPDPVIRNAVSKALKGGDE